MNTPAPGYLFPFLLVGSLLTITALVAGLSTALTRAAWPIAARRQAVASVAAIGAAWYLFAWGSSAAGLYSDRVIPTIQYPLLLPLLIGIVVFRGSRTLHRLIDAIPQRWLIAVQLYRVEGVVFLLLYAAGYLPAAFALPAGIGDVLVGLAAPFVARRYARNPGQNARSARAWNFAGILDLTIAVSMGFLTSPTPIQMFGLDNPNRMVGAFPLAIIPTFLVPLSILLHAASLYKLRAPQFAADSALQPSTT